MNKKVSRLIKKYKSHVISYIFGFILLTMVLTQLFEFDDFLKTIGDFHFFGGGLIGGLIVVFEVFALPYLIDMKIRPMLRNISVVCGVLAAIFWFKLSIWSTVVIGGLADIGVFGGIVKFESGLWAIAFSIGLCVLAVLSYKKLISSAFKH